MNTKQENIIRTDYAEIMQKSYIDYAMSVIISRALPDVRDGLKPVQRRTLSQNNGVKVHTVVKHTWYIRTSDTGCFYFYLYISRYYLRFLYFLVTHIFICHNNCCFHDSDSSFIKYK